MNTDELRDALRRDAELAGRPPTDLVHRVSGLRRRTRRRWAGVVACVLAMAGAVGGLTVLDGAREQDRDAAATAVVDPEVAAAAYRGSIAGAGAGASRAFSPDSLVGFLPNSMYADAFTGGAFALSDAVVVGHVTSVSRGRGFSMSEEDETFQVPFDDPRAVWRTLHAEVAVTEVLGGQLGGNAIVVGLVWGPQRPFEVAAEGLPALGEIVFFLQKESAVYEYDADLWAIPEDGAIMAEIGSDGRLTLPAVEVDRARLLLERTPTLDSLRAAAQEPMRVLPVETPQD